MSDAPTNPPSSRPTEPTESSPSQPNPLVKLVIEAGPLAVFFIAYVIGEGDKAIFVATGAFMVAIIPSLIASRLLERRWPPLALATAVFVLVLGGLTLYFKESVFIKVKPTVVNVLFAFLLGTGLLMGKNFLKFVFGPAFKLTEVGWRLLTYRWILFFLFLALLNEIVWRNFSEGFWVKFKVFGIMPLTIVFTITLLPLLSRHELKEEDEEENPLPEDDEVGERSQDHEAAQEHRDR